MRGLRELDRKPLSSFDLLPEHVARVVAYGLSIGLDMVITVDADYKWKVHKV